MQGVDRKAVRASGYWAGDEEAARIIREIGSEDLKKTWDCRSYASRHSVHAVLRGWADGVQSRGVTRADIGRIAGDCSSRGFGYSRRPMLCSPAVEWFVG